MDGRMNTCDSEESKAACWVRQVVYVLLAATALLALLVAFAVEVVSTPAPLGW